MFKAFIAPKISVIKTSISGIGPLGPSFANTALLAGSGSVDQVGVGSILFHKVFMSCTEENLAKPSLNMWGVQLAERSVEGSTTQGRGPLNCWANQQWVNSCKVPLIAG